MPAHSIDVLTRNEPTRSGAFRYIALGVCLDCNWQGALHEDYTPAFDEAAAHRFNPNRTHEVVILKTYEDEGLTRAIAVCLTCPWRGTPHDTIHPADNEAREHEDGK